MGELKAGMVDVDNYMCSCGKRIRTCPLWMRIASAHTDRGLPFALDNFATRFEQQPGLIAGRLLGARLRGPVSEFLRDLAISTFPGVRRARDRTLRTIEAFADIMMEVTHTNVFVDASKDAFRLKYLRAMTAYPMKVIRIIRDGRGVTNSTRVRERRTVAQASRMWLNDSLELDRVQEWFEPDCWLTVHYEELCVNPDATLARLFAFVGLDGSQAASDFRSVEHHILANAMRLRDSSTIELDQKWKTQLSREDLAMFELIAGSVNSFYGY